MPLTVIVLFSAFAVGMVISSSNTCAVAASRELLLQRRGTMLLGFLLAMGVAGTVTLPLHWWLGPAAHLVPEVPISGALLLGAMLIGVGALINDACLLGTLARIGQGEIRFLALPFGLAIGFAIADRQSLLLAGVAQGNSHTTPMWPGISIVLGFALIASWAWYARGRLVEPDGSKPAWPRAMMLVMGLCSALLFALEPRWAYSDAVHAIVQRGEMDMQSDSRTLAPAVALLCGAVLSGLRSRSFVLRVPKPKDIARSLAGGTVMAIGGVLIPGGNDTLLLAAIPSGTLSGLTAYLVMTGTVLAVLQSAAYLGRQTQLNLSNYR